MSPEITINGFPLAPDQVGIIERMLNAQISVHSALAPADNEDLACLFSIRDRMERRGKYHPDYESQEDSE